MQRHLLKRPIVSYLKAQRLQVMSRQEALEKIAVIDKLIEEIQILLKTNQIKKKPIGSIKVKIHSRILIRRLIKMRQALSRSLV